MAKLGRPGDDLKLLIGRSLADHTSGATSAYEHSWRPPYGYP